MTKAYLNDVKLVCEREGKKVQVSRSNVQEIFKVIQDVSAEQLAAGKHSLSLRLHDGAVAKARKLIAKKTKAKKKARTS